MFVSFHLRESHSIVIAQAAAQCQVHSLSFCSQQPVDYCLSSKSLAPSVEIIHEDLLSPSMSAHPSFSLFWCYYQGTSLRSPRFLVGTHLSNSTIKERNNPPLIYFSTEWKDVQQTCIMQNNLQVPSENMPLSCQWTTTKIHLLAKTSFCDQVTKSTRNPAKSVDVI